MTPSSSRLGRTKASCSPSRALTLRACSIAVDFLREVSLTGRATLGNKVVVIGGGNVGVDTARTARRAGAKDVHLVCIECRDEMPAMTGR